MAPKKGAEPEPEPEAEAEPEPEEGTGSFVFADGSKYSTHTIGSRCLVRESTRACLHVAQWEAG